MGFQANDPIEDDAAAQHIAPAAAATVATSNSGGGRVPLCFLADDPIDSFYTAVQHIAPAAVTTTASSSSGSFGISGVFVNHFFSKTAILSVVLLRHEPACA